MALSGCKTRIKKPRKIKVNFNKRSDSKWKREARKKEKTLINMGPNAV